MIARAGQPAPGTDAFFSGFSPYYSLINDAGDVAFQAVLTGGTADATNNTGIWIWRSGTLSKVVREGDPVAGMPGTTYDSFIGWNMLFNDLGQIVVHGQSARRRNQLQPEHQRGVGLGSGQGFVLRGAER